MSSVNQDECDCSSEGDQTNTSDDSDKKKQSSQGNQITEDAKEQNPPPLAVAQQCTQGGNDSTVSKETGHEELIGDVVKETEHSDPHATCDANDNISRSDGASGEKGKEANSEGKESSGNNETDIPCSKKSDEETNKMEGTVGESTASISSKEKSEVKEDGKEEMGSATSAGRDQHENDVEMDSQSSDEHSESVNKEEERKKGETKGEQPGSEDKQISSVGESGQKEKVGGVIFETNGNDPGNNDVEMCSHSSGNTESVSSEEEDKRDKNKKKNEGDLTREKKAKDSGSGEEDSEWERPWWRFFGGTSSRSKKISLPSLSRYSSYDTEQYRQGYPGKGDDPSISHNFEFYTNKRPSYPEGDLIDNIHENWWGNYRLLEYHHSYIQWLFPIRETGLNWYAKELQPHEIKQICEDPEALERVIKSYEMMLDFYGLKLVDKSSGDVERSQGYAERFDNLNYSSHNYLRITRILKCLGEFGLEHFKVPLIKHLLQEAIIERTLLNALNSCVNYWIAVVKDDKERDELYKYAKELVEQANQETKPR